MKKFLRPTETCREDGFTLVELIATIVIMGLVIAPLTTALMQALKLVPANGDRTEYATDADRTLKVFSDDIAQAQTVYDFLNNPNLVFNEPAAPLTPWTTLNAPSAPLHCSDTAGTWILWSVFADMGATPPGAPVAGAYLVAITPAGNAKYVELRRLDSASGTWSVLMNGYCGPGLDPVTLQTWAPNPSAASPSFHEEVRMTVSLMDHQGNRLPDAVFDGTVRAVRPG